MVGGELGQRRAASARTRVSEITRVDGNLPLTDIDREIAALESLRAWDITIYNQISAEFAKERSSTRRSIKEAEDQLKALPPSDVVPRINLLQQLSALAGAGADDQARYARERKEILSKVSKEAEEAIQSENYEKAQGLLGIVNEVNPQDEIARKKKCDVDGKVIVKRFNAALETGRFGKTMDMLNNFSETDCFGDIRAGLAREAGPVAEAFGILGQESMSKGDLAGA